MPIRVMKFFVPVCPVCGALLSFDGERGFNVFKTRAALHETADECGRQDNFSYCRSFDGFLAGCCGRVCENRYNEGWRRRGLVQVNIKHANK